MGQRGHQTQRNRTLGYRCGCPHLFNGRTDWYDPLGHGIHDQHALGISKANAVKLGLFASVLGHVGDGNFHQIVFYNPDSPQERQAVQDCVEAMMHRALEMDGTVSVSGTRPNSPPLYGDNTQTGGTRYWFGKKGDYPRVSLLLRCYYVHIAHI